jgi:hypothetical protein
VLRIYPASWKKPSRPILSGELNAEAFVEWFLKHYSHPKARPVIIAADELGMVSEGQNNDSLKSVLSAIAAIIQEFKTTQLGRARRLAL